MNADLYLRQGDTHAVCQDYAEARLTERGLTLAVCDGCSSSPMTDIGARLLARAALGNVHRCGGLDDIEAFAASTIDRAAASARLMELPLQCLDSTLIVVDIDDDHGRAAMFGDGALAVGNVDGSVRVWSVDYTSNAPDYLSYRLDLARRAAYADLVDGSECVIRRLEWGGKRALMSTTEPLTSGPLVLDIDEPIRWIAAMTDGVKSFTRPVQSTSTKGREPVDEVDVLTDVLDFVNVNGKFVERQVRWFAAECEKRGWKHSDDLGIAAISFDREP